MRFVIASFKLFSAFLLSAEAVVQSCSVKKVFLKISENSQKKTCVTVSFLIKLQAAPAASLKKRLWYRCFLVNFPKFLRTAFFTEHFRWLLLFQSDQQCLRYILFLKYCWKLQKTVYFSVFRDYISVTMD